MFYPNKLNKVFIFPLIFISLFLISGCGFKPLYSEKNYNDLFLLESNIYINKIDGRVGQILRNSLLEQYGTANHSVKDFILDIKITKSIVPLAFRSDKTVTRFNVVITGQFVLKQTNSDSILTSGNANSIASYSVVLSEFANLSAAKDAEERAAIDLAKKISRFISVFLINFAADE